MQQPSWLQSASPHNVHSVHLLIDQRKTTRFSRTVGRHARLFYNYISEGEHRERRQYAGKMLRWSILSESPSSCAAKACVAWRLERKRNGEKRALLARFLSNAKNACWQGTAKKGENLSYCIEET